MEDDVLMGEIKLFAGGLPPSRLGVLPGTGPADRNELALFSLLGTQSGGDGVTTFGLPSLAALTPAGAGAAPINYIICVNGIYTRRQDQ
ncbi:MAG: tail fiber protein [Candidatus Nanopelagicales bacterium]